MSNTLERVQSPMSNCRTWTVKLAVLQVRDIRSGVTVCAGSGNLVPTSLEFGRWTLDLVLIYFERSGSRFRKVHLEAVAGKASFLSSELFTERLERDAET